MTLLRRLIRALRDLTLLADDGVTALTSPIGKARTRWRIYDGEPDAVAFLPGRQPTVLRLPQTAGAFEREIRLPAEAKSALDETVKLNLARWSPFDPADTLSAVVPGTERWTDGVLTFRLAMASRRRIARGVAQARASGITGRVCVDVSDGQRLAPVYDLLTGGRPRSGPIRPGEALVAMAGISTVAGLVGLALMGASRGAHVEAAGAPASEAVIIDRLKRSSPSAVASIAGIAAALPDNTFLDELRFDATGVVLTGRSSDAGELPVRIEATQAFTRARLVGAVTPDPNGGERFVLSAEFLPRGPAR